MNQTKQAGEFEKQYQTLNPAQKEAVDAIEGPVMVVAGPGTGKTQILALRIGNILQKTDIKPNGILCLTFTNAAVEAMKKRLTRYIGETAEEVGIFTFHSFGMKVIEEHFRELGFPQAPTLLEDTEAVIFFDGILQSREWEYLRPRADTARYFQDLKSLISILKRERMSSDEFQTAIEKEIKFLSEREESFSTRGPSKGQLKKEVEREIEGLKRSLEIVTFLEIYDQEKKAKDMLDYDDVLECLVKLVETNEDALAEIRERYLYVLVDEHQDSSLVQNEFLAKVWGTVERPDIFVVGDDRQLIYGFSGASVEYFKGFKKNFPGAKLIPLVDNYRSTQVILDASHTLLKSVMSDEKLISQSSEHHPIRLIEADTARAEIKAAGMDIKEKKLPPDDCAILVPKNRQVREALVILHEMGLPVATLEALNLFDQPEMQALIRVLKVIDTGEARSLALSFFDPCSGIAPIDAHRFIAGENMRNFSFDTLQERAMYSSANLFGENSIDVWIQKLISWKEVSKELSLEVLVKKVGSELCGGKAEGLVMGEDLVSTLLDLLTKRMEREPGLTLGGFITHLGRLELYGEHVPLITTPKEGVHVLTMHSSKGLEFEYVWIAHVDERSLAGGKKVAFTLPESIAEKVEERDVDAIKRKLYVAITRAKRFCTLSYALESKSGREQALAGIIDELPSEVFHRERVTGGDAQNTEAKDRAEIAALVKGKYADRYLSVSLLNNFFECPWKWYFNNLLGVPQAPSLSLEFGSLVHGAIDAILNLHRPPTLRDLEALALPPEVRRIVERWVEHRLPEIEKNYNNEQSVSWNDPSFSHLKLYGKIDLIENLSGKEVRVTDFKTGSVRKKSDIEKIDDEGRMSGNLRQLAMYSFLLEQNPKWGKIVRQSRLEFLEAKNPKESFYDRVVTPTEIKLLVRDIEDYDELLKSGEWIHRSCNYNSYGKNEPCQYCELIKSFEV